MEPIPRKVGAHLRKKLSCLAILFFDSNSVAGIGVWGETVRGLAYIDPPAVLQKRPRTGGSGQQPDRATLLQVDQFLLDEFERQNLVNLKCVVSIAPDMSFEHALQTVRAKVRPAARGRIEKRFLQPFRELISIPDAKVMEFVPADEQPFEMKWCKGMVKPGKPLRHAIIIGIFCLKGELLVPV